MAQLIAREREDFMARTVLRWRGTRAEADKAAESGGILLRDQYGLCDWETFVTDKAEYEFRYTSDPVRFAATMGAQHLAAMTAGSYHFGERSRVETVLPLRDASRDWACEYCRGLNPPTCYNCPSCGARRMAEPSFASPRL